ncbi:MAG: GHMP kinase [Deltaproteobacteria bacterium]|nr:GHMP kinase [Deltaproteobacteria bacterium]
MIISQTPLRMSFVGGGSDLPSFYRKQPGAVISTTIDKYIYINVNKKFDNLIRASYSITEFAAKPSKLKHELIRESLKLLGIKGGIEITSIADIPSGGTGLGSSSTYTVGLLNALNAYLSRFSSKEYLASTACQIEIKNCHKPIGKQDQYAAAYGGLNLIEFRPDDTVAVNPIICSTATKHKLNQNLLLLYTGITRSADKILANQNKNTISNIKTRDILGHMVKLAYSQAKALSNDDLKSFGEALDENWNLKTKLSQGISNPTFDRWYKTAKSHGALGGKILGAGGGGFLLLYAPKSKHDAIINALPKLRKIDFSFDTEGSKIIYYQQH